MFKILALDGGGIKGTFTASVLTEIEAMLHNSIVDYFDLIVGTSTGGLIALGLGCDFKAQSILDLYKSKGKEIFPPAASGWVGLLDRFFDSMYDDIGLRDAARGLFGERSFTSIKHGLAITSLNADSAHPVVFKTKYDPTLVAYDDLSVVDVALATSAAPTYFPAASNSQGVFIDGGVWANCPVMVGITEAIGLFKKTPREIGVLSIGTTSTPIFINKEQCEGGLISWAKTPISMMMHAIREGNLNQAKKLSHNFLRIDEVVETGRFKLDSVNHVPDLERLGKQAAHRNFNSVLEIFLSEKKKFIQQTNT